MVLFQRLAVGRFFVLLDFEIEIENKPKKTKDVKPYPRVINKSQDNYGSSHYMVDTRPTLAKTHPWMEASYCCLSNPLLAFSLPYHYCS